MSKKILFIEKDDSIVLEYSGEDRDCKEWLCTLKKLDVTRLSNPVPVKASGMKSGGEFIDFMFIYRDVNKKQIKNNKTQSAPPSTIDKFLRYIG